MVRSAALAGGLSGLVACSPPRLDAESSDTARPSTSVVVATSTSTVTGSSSTVTGSSSTVADNGRASRSHAQVTLSGGTIEVTGARGVLTIVQVQPQDGWVSSVEQPAAGELVVTFTRGTAAEVVRMSLVGDSIRTVTSAAG